MACFSVERKHLQFWYWVVPEKIHPAPKDENSAVRKRREEKFVSDNSKCIRTLAGDMGGGGVTPNFLCGGGVDVFWNDPIEPKLFFTTFL
jgi:hypothetical protein